MAEPNFQVLSIRNDGAEGTRGLQSKRYQKRKTHAKSREGCASCKVKRVKCDEAKPACGRCQRSGAPCSYTYSDSSTSSSHMASRCSNVPSFIPSDSSLSPFDTSLDLDRKASPWGTPRITLLHHFSMIFHDLVTFGAQASGSFITLGLSRPHVLDAMLAVSASHLRHHTPSPAPHRVAEHYQQSLAVRGFQTALSEPLVDHPGSDSLLLTAMLLNLLAFSLVEFDGTDDAISQSWVFSDSPNRLAWFSLQLGYKPLLLATKQWHSKGSIMSWMFSASDDDQGTFNGGPWSLHKVPLHWLRLCGLASNDNTGQSIFHEPLRTLAEVRDLEPLAENYFLYLAPVGRFDIEFRDLLEANDERSMWVFGYWLGLCCRFDYWWMRNRANRDHRAIRVWLDKRSVRKRHGEEGVMWRALMEDLEAAPYYPPDPGTTCEACEFLDDHV